MLQIPQLLCCAIRSTSRRERERRTADMLLLLLLLLVHNQMQVLPTLNRKKHSQKISAVRRKREKNVTTTLHVRSFTLLLYTTVYILKLFTCQFFCRLTKWEREEREIRASRSFTSPIVACTVTNALRVLFRLPLLSRQTTEIWWQQQKKLAKTVTRRTVL